MMEDMQLFAFACSLNKQQARSGEEEATDAAKMGEAMQPGLETRVRNSLQKGMQAGQAAFAGIKYVVKMSQVAVAAQDDKDARVQLIGQVIAALGTTVAPQFPAVAAAWVAMQPALKEMLLLIDAYYVYKAALKQV